MENEKYQDEFEQFLQDEVKQHRMYPSDHIWKNIRTEIHGSNTWSALTFISLFIITALTISTLLINHPSEFLVKSASIPKISNTVTNAKTFMLDVNSNEIASLNQLQQNASTQKIVSNTINYKGPLLQNPPLQTPTEITSNQIINPELNIKVVDQTVFAENKLTGGIEVLPSKLVNEGRNEENSISVEKVKTDKIISVDEYLNGFSYQSNKKQQPKVSKFGFQVYLTPSTSYRILSDEKVKEVLQPISTASQVVTQIAPLSANYSNYSNNVNHVVRHRPAMGLELGFAVLYNMSDRIKFKTGVQVNIRQYYIETYQSRTNDLTSISVINQRGVETINFYSPYNNNTGFKQTELDNKLYQVSIPIGIQWDLIRGKHFGINTEASVQPTYTLNNNTYLLTTDYNHYADGTDFIRNWNINSSVGLNISYKSGSTTWQIGPQLRYQHLPTYSNLYPIKEFLIDYGVRFGFTKQIR